MRVAALILIGVVAGGALFGGALLASQPDGTLLGLDPGLLPQWYPGDYLGPGLLLLVGFGVGGAATILLLSIRSPWGWPAVLTIGIGLLTWMVLQAAMIGLILPPMQLGFVAISITLILLSAMTLSSPLHRSAQIRERRGRQRR